MAVCSFLGHWDIYDADIENRLQAAVDKVVNRNESVEFWLYPHGEFFNYCLLAVLRARTRCPRRVRIRLVVNERQYTDIMEQKPGSIPACMADSITMFHMEYPSQRDWAIPYKGFLRFVVEKSDYVISYLYQKLYDPENHVFSFAEKRADTEIISVVSAETEQIIVEDEGLMSEQEQVVFQKIGDGCSLKEAGGLLGVGRERTRQILRHGCGKIKKDLERRRRRACAALGGLEYVCGIFGLGKENYQAMKGFKCVMDFLKSRYQVKRIYIDGRYAESGFMMILKEWYPFGSEVHVTAVTDEEAFSEDETEGLLDMRFCPPCDAVRYAGRAGAEDSLEGFTAIADIIEQSDFCLFHGGFEHGAGAGRLAACRKRTAVFVDLDRGANRRHRAV